MAVEPRCANCSMRKNYDLNPSSTISKLWRWHINWCPGWKAYMNSLSEDEYKSIQLKYNWKINN